MVNFFRVDLRLFVTFFNNGGYILAAREGGEHSYLILGIPAVIFLQQESYI